MYLMIEELTRDRMRQAQRDAEQSRMARRQRRIRQARAAQAHPAVGSAR